VKIVAMKNEIEKQGRVIVRIELTPSVKAVMTDVVKRNGMTQVAVTSRLLEWFARQDAMVQAAVLGHYPDAIRSEIAALILKKIPGKRK
jgi:hypothetical protein